MPSPLSFRPGQSLNMSIPFDADLSCDLFKHITACMEHLPDNEQSIIAAFFTTTDDIYTAVPALEALVSRNELLLARTVAAESSMSFHFAMAPALMVWALNQKWSGNTFDQQMISKWVSHCLGSRSFTSAISSATLFMAQLIPLASSMPLTTRSKFLEDTLKEIYRHATPWKNPQHTELSIYYLSLSHTISSLCPNTTSPPGQNMLDIWRDNAALTICAEGNSINRLALGTWLATSSLPAQDRLDVLDWCGPEIWALPCVSHLLLPTLPTSERERFNKLPWATQGGNAKSINKTLVQTYCPVSFPLIELAAQTDDWNCNSAIANWVLCANTPAPETFPLPHDCAPTA